MEQALRILEVAVRFGGMRLAAFESAEREVGEREVGLQVEAAMECAARRFAVADFLQNGGVQVMCGGVDLIARDPLLAECERLREMASIGGLAR